MLKNWRMLGNPNGYSTFADALAECERLAASEHLRHARVAVMCNHGEYDINDGRYAVVRWVGKCAEEAGHE
jgi:hypothetical protein